MFAKIQSLQKQYRQFVTDCTVNETSLEDIFLQFAHTNHIQSTQQSTAIESLSIWEKHVKFSLPNENSHARYWFSQTDGGGEGEVEKEQRKPKAEEEKIINGIFIIH